MTTKTPDPSLDLLRSDFRNHLQQFYALLNLASPYHSLEQAIRLLSIEYKRKTPEEVDHLIKDLNLRWKFYDAIFFKSGLSQKHRGIIRRLIQSNPTLSVPAPYKNFLTAFHA